jgi:hypothetical protein
MRIVLILAALAILARLFDQRWLGVLVFLFILGCALFGVGEFLRDCFDGHGFSVRGQMRRAAEQRTPEQDEAIVQAFESWKAARELRRARRGVRNTL